MDFEDNIDPSMLLLKAAVDRCFHLTEGKFDRASVEKSLLLRVKSLQIFDGSSFENALKYIALNDPNISRTILLAP